MLKIGITGGIGTGKTTVCRIFEILGIPVFHSDDESKLLLQYDDDVIKQVKESFGEDVYEYELPDRKKIAAMVFHSPQKLKTLNNILHPAVRRKFETWLKEQHHVPYIIKEAALIYEAGIDAELDKVIVVTAPESLRLKRIQARDKVDENEVRARMKNQWTEEEKMKRADFIVHNDEQQLLIPQVMKIHEQFLKHDEQLHVL